MLNEARKSKKQNPYSPSLSNTLFLLLLRTHLAVQSQGPVSGKAQDAFAALERLWMMSSLSAGCRAGFDHLQESLEMQKFGASPETNGDNFI